MDQPTSVRVLRPGRLWQRFVLTSVLAALLLGVTDAPRAAPAQGATPSTLAAGWIPGWAAAPGQLAVEANADLVGEASPFWYSATASGGAVTIAATVGPEAQAPVVASLRARGIPVIPSIADASAARAMAAVIADPGARAAHLAQLLALVTGNGFDGVELDYEKFAFSDGSSTWAATRPAWVAFVAQLADALHRTGKRLALAVPPMYDGTRTSTSGYWVYDYAGIAPYVDSLRIMTYDYSVSRPGPIAPLSFLNRTLSYAVSVFPASRIRMGVPAYGRLWRARRPDGSPSVTGTCPTGAVPDTTSFTTASAASYLTTFAGVPPTVLFDPTTGESVATFSKEYRGPGPDGLETACVVDHVAWWVDARGVAARLPLVGAYGLAGIAVWHLGGVDGESWAAIRAYAQGWSAPVPAPTATPGTPPAATTVTVTASTLRPKRGHKVTLRVQVSPARKGVKVQRQRLVRGHWRTVATKRTTSKGRVKFVVTWPRKRVHMTYRIVSMKKGSLARGTSERFTIRTR